MTFLRKKEIYACMTCGEVQSAINAAKYLPCEKCGGNTFQRKEEWLEGTLHGKS